MTGLWHYSKDGKKMDPVPADELKQLAASGQLQPTDLVWTQGMAQWEDAGSVGELFPDAGGGSNFATVSAPHGGKPQGIEAFATSGSGQAKRAKSGGGLLLVVVAVAACLLAFVVGCVIFFFPNITSITSSPMRGEYSWSLGTNGTRNYNIYLRKNHRTELRVHSTGNSDVDLYVYRGSKLLRKDTKLSRNCYIYFVPPVDGYYKVKVWNRRLYPDSNRRNAQNSGKLTYWQGEFNRPERTKTVAAVEKQSSSAEKGPSNAKKEGGEKSENKSAPNKNGPGKPAPAKTIKKPQPRPNVVVRPATPPIHRPAAVDPSTASMSLDSNIYGNLRKGKRVREKHQVYLHANITYTIDLKSDQFDTVLQLDNAQGRRLAFNDDAYIGKRRLNSRIVYTPTKSGRYDLLVRAFAYNGSGPYQLIVWRK